MSQRTLRCFPVALTVAAALALSGCGGGGSSTTPDGGTGSGMTGDGQPLVIPEGLTRLRQ